MDRKKPPVGLDEVGLIIIGAGACVSYYFFDRAINPAQGLSTFLTIAVIMSVTLFNQFLINKINRSKNALQEANDNLEIKVRERTAELRESESKYRTIFQNTGAATVIVEDDTRISLANSVFINMTGYKKDEVEYRKSWLEFIDDKDHRKLIVGESSATPPDSGEQEPRYLECRFLDRSRNFRDMLITLAKIPGTFKSVVSLMDISELKEAERKIYRQAFHDTLTGLPNRALFVEYLTMAIKRRKRKEDYRFAVLYMDIDRFKLVNDSLGHGAGDRLLVEFTNRLLDSLRDTDTLARFGGDEFVLLLDDIGVDNYATYVAERLLQNLKTPFAIDGKDVFAPASIGIVLNTYDYEDPHDIIRDADAAMYHAKEKGRAQFKIFDKKLHEKAMHLLRREADLRRAILNEEFELHYQPIVSLESLSIVGFEALIRWNHPQDGLVYPSSFIPIAEETGLIVQIGKWVVRQACQDMRKWQDQLKCRLPFFMSVNISGKHFLRPNLLDDVQEVFRETGIQPEQLKLEITETVLMEDTEEAIFLVQRLKDLGVQIVIDDFGTGYSSLSYLQRLPIDTLKVDRGFISNIIEGPEGNRNIVEAVISLAHRLDLNVVAEGVETPEQQSLLSHMRCQYGQGHLFSRPLAKDKMSQLIYNLSRIARESPASPCRLPDLLVAK